MYSNDTNYPKHDAVMIGKGLNKVCTYQMGNKNQVNPHPKEVRDHTKKIKDDVTDCIGNTPLVRINTITKNDGIQCEVLGKCEFLNPGGSVKDRIARRMIKQAEKDGRIKPGDILAEPTTGNTGVGISMVGAALGYKVIIALTERMSQEKCDTMRGLGADVIKTPTEYRCDHVDSHVGRAVHLSRTLPNCHHLDAFSNVSNPMVHYEETGQEIWDACDGRLDYVFLGAGTAGTLTGVARKLKDLNPNIKIICMDPKGSDLAPARHNAEKPEFGYTIEGLGYDFTPRVCDSDIVDEWIKTDDEQSYKMARRLIKEEGLIVGGTSGTHMHYALEYIKKHNIGKGKRCIVFLTDGVRNYMSRFLNNDWMYENGFITEEECVKLNSTTLVKDNDWGADLTVAELPLVESPVLKTSTTMNEAIDLMKKYKQNFFPVLDENNKVVGTLTAAHLMEKFTKRKLTMQDPIGKFAIRTFRRVSQGIKINELCRIFTRLSYVVVDEKYVLQHEDLLNFMQQREANNEIAPNSIQQTKKEETKIEQADIIAVDESDNSRSKMITMAALASSACAAAVVYAMQSKN